MATLAPREHHVRRGERERVIKTIRPVKQKLKGYKIKMTVDGKESEWFLSKKNKHLLRELLDKNAMKGIKVEFKEVYD